MRTLDTPGARDELTTRLGSLRGELTPLWGRMSAPQMLRHLTLALEGAAGARPLQVTRGRWSPLRNRLGRFMVLESGVRWPRNVGTVPELARLDQAPIELSAFEDVRRDQVQRLADFAALAPESLLVEHPFFGPFTRTQWMRWAYLHTDHHLRQFGC